ncbi:MAG: NADH-quinone oxidoreductase subunit NuoK [Dehalococcoidia bacterium]|nr:NADH-quinone oxidoreductase subunit NuoK [Dehalococcoidia bacterium]
MDVGLTHYLVLSAILFSIGLFGALSKRNAIGVLMCIEIMLNAVNIAVVAFSRYLAPETVILTGHVFALFVIVVAAAEAAVGLAIVIALYKNRETVDVEEADSMKG